MADEPIRRLIDIVSRDALKIAKFSSQPVPVRRKLSVWKEGKGEKREQKEGTGEFRNPKSEIRNKSQ